MAELTPDRVIYGMGQHVRELGELFGGDSLPGVDIEAVRQVLRSGGLMAESEVLTIPFDRASLELAREVGEQAEWPDPFIHQQIGRMLAKLDGDVSGDEIGLAGPIFSELSSTALIFGTSSEELQADGVRCSAAMRTRSVGHELTHGALMHLATTEWQALDADTVRIQGRSGLHQQLGSILLRRGGQAETGASTASWIDEAFATHWSATVMERLAADALYDGQVITGVPEFSDEVVEVPGRFIVVTDEGSTGHVDGGVVAALGLERLVEQDAEFAQLLTAVYTDAGALPGLHSRLRELVGEQTYGRMTSRQQSYDNWRPIHTAIQQL